MVDIRISARNMELTDAIKSYCEEKISKYDYLMQTATDLGVELTENISHRGTDQDFLVEIDVHLPNASIMVKQNGKDIYALIDSATDVLSRRLKRYKERLRYWEGHENWKVDYFDNIEESVPDLVDEVDDYSGYVPKISKRVKLDDTEPIHEAEAIEHMELRGLNSYLFKNSETGGWSLLRKTPKGYELLETPS
jgi:putative sigma-54 modulation protein